MPGDLEVDLSKYGVLRPEMSLFPDQIDVIRRMHRYRHNKNTFIESSIIYYIVTGDRTGGGPSIVPDVESGYWVESIRFSIQSGGIVVLSTARSPPGHRQRDRSAPAGVTGHPAPSSSPT